MAPRRSAAEERAQVADRRLQRERVVLRSGVAAARTETTATPAPSCNRPAAFLSAAEEVETLLPGLECTPPGVGRCGAHLRGRRSQGRSRGGEQRLQGLGVDPREHRLARDRRPDSLSHALVPRPGRVVGAQVHGQLGGNVDAVDVLAPLDGHPVHI